MINNINFSDISDKNELKVVEVLVNTNNYNAILRKTFLKEYELKKILNSLINRKKIILVEKKYYLLYVGTLSLKNSNFGFIEPKLITNDEKIEDEYVHHKNLGNACDTDTVLYYLTKDKYRYDKMEAIIVSVLERGKTFIVGKVVKSPRKNSKSLFVIPSDNKTFDWFKINGGLNVLPGMIVKGEIKYLKHDVYLIIKEILGNVDDPGIEIKTIAYTYGFETNFNEEVKAELLTIPTKVEGNLTNFKDFRNLDIITIDGDDSKDFDDAVNVRINENGNYLLGVYIADVSYYVKPSSPLDKEAYKRGTSVYLADRVIPMLPHELSNGICSLNEGEDRLVLAITMEIDSSGNVLNKVIEEGIIRSRHRMTYNKVNKILKGDSDLINEYNDIYEMLLNMNKLHEIIRKKRYEKGALEFETDEYKFTLDENGKPLDINLRVRDEAEKLIEDFMIIANEEIAKSLTLHNYPCLFRVHETPEQEKLRDVFNLITNMGIKINNEKGDINPKKIQDALTNINESNLAPILNNLLLRSMMKAKYDPNNIGHYGLALDYYCHFTSPIRRYPDLIIHRLVKDLLLGGSKNKAKTINYYEAVLPEMGLKTSVQERRSIECEREVDDMLYAWYMEDNISKTFSGIITSITSFGMFVTIDKGVEGLVRIDDLLNDYFTFDEKKLILTSPSKTYHLGDKVKVVVINSDRETKKIDFMLESDYKLKEEYKNE